MDDNGSVAQLFVKAPDAARCFLGFEDGKWAKYRSTVEERLPGLLGERLVGLVVAGVNPTGGGASMLRAGVMVVTDQDVRFYNRSITEPAKAIKPEVVLPLADIVEVKRRDSDVRVRTTTTKVTLSIPPWLRGHVADFLDVAVEEVRLLNIDPLDVSEEGIQVIVLGALGYACDEGQRLRLWLEDDAIVLATPHSELRIDLPFREVTKLDVGGRGAVTSGGGFIGGGFGISGFLIGAATANVLNGLTSRSQVETTLAITTVVGELHLFTASMLPADIDIALAPVRQGMDVLGGPRRGADVLDQIQRLAALHDAGVVTDAEFESKKRDLLGRL